MGEVRVQGKLRVIFHSLFFSFFGHASQSVCVSLFSFSSPSFLLGQLRTFALIKWQGNLSY